MLASVSDPCLLRDNFASIAFSGLVRKDAIWLSLVKKL
jgi:hypothetical protein